MKDKIVFTVYSSGDYSVGLNDITLKVIIEDITLKDLTDPIVNGKEELRKDLQKFFGEWLDNPNTKIYFEGERT